MDFRLRRQLSDFILYQGLEADGVDIIQVAGSALNLARPAEPGDREFILRQLRISHSLHRVRQIYLINHEDCGAYGAEDMPDSSEELEQHAEDLGVARKMLEEEFPGVEVMTFFIYLDGRARLID